MSRSASWSITIVTSLAIAVVTGAAARGQAIAPTVGITVSKETAPPGGMAQVKVFITEPTPVTTGGGSYAFAAYDSVEGIALMNELEDVAGIALVRGTEVTLAFESPSGTFGMDPDYPVLTVAGRIPAGTPIGVKFPLVFDASVLKLVDPAGNPYVIEAKPGHLITQPGLSIHDVNPGSAIVPAGGIVTISGSGFTRGTEIRFKEAKLSRVTYVNANEIRVTVATQTHMHGMAIRASNPDGTRSTYFSYQRTRPHGASMDPVLQFAVPLIPPHAATSADIDFPASGPSTTFGVAVQNIANATAVVAIVLLDAAGNVVATAEDIGLPAHRFAVRELSELFGFAPEGTSTVRVSSSSPVQVLGVSTDQSAGTASPIRHR